MVGEDADGTRQVGHGKGYAFADGEAGGVGDGDLEVVLRILAIAEWEVGMFGGGEGDGENAVGADGNCVREEQERAAGVVRTHALDPRGVAEGLADGVGSAGGRHGGAVAGVDAALDGEGTGVARGVAGGLEGEREGGKGVVGNVEFA